MKFFGIMFIAAVFALPKIGIMAYLILLGDLGPSEAVTYVLDALSFV